MDRNRLIREWIGFLVILAGFGLLASPFLMGWEAGRQQRQSLSRVKTVTVSRETETSAPEMPGNEPAPEEEAVPVVSAEEDPLYARCAQYNEELAASGQSAMVDLASVENFDIDSRDYGSPENTIGSLWIPRMEVELPLYLGTSSEHMARGAAVFGQTSVPMSGTVSGTTAIAGHRGWRGTPMFRDIQKMQIGDPIYIETPWETLVYRVTELRIVTPDDSSWCMIEEGQNRIALMTCHPYTKHYQRYVVIAGLSPEEPIISREEVMEELAATADETPRQVRDTSGETEEIVLVDTTTIEPDGTEYGSVWSNAVILAERKMIPVAWGAGILVVLTALWLTGKTWRYLRGKSRDNRDTIDRKVHGEP